MIQIPDDEIEYIYIEPYMNIVIKSFKISKNEIRIHKNIRSRYMKHFTKNMTGLTNDRDLLENVLFGTNQSHIKSSKRSRKQKKMNDKQILHFFANENADDRDQYVRDTSNMVYENGTKMYESITHMSGHERKHFDDKFHSPKNDSQTQYINLLKNKHKKIVVANGPAGTGKTLFATEYGIRYFSTNVYDKLIFTRPSVSVDEDLGYLPGTLEEKMAPWVRPIYDILYRFITPKEVTRMLEEKLIEIAPLGYMRGRTFENAWIVADEMQNSTISQMKMLMTRLGTNSRLVVTGDLDQHDKVGVLNGLEDFLHRFKGKRSSSISSLGFERDDIQREEVVKEVLEIYGSDQQIDYSSECSSRSRDENDSEEHSAITQDRSVDDIS
jgi:phosphate starvation-inducible protein PhoH and related proteins